jgi:hypothetical protein
MEHRVCLVGSSQNGEFAAGVGVVRTAHTGANAYVRDWSYPANDAEPATGLPSRGIGRPLSRDS